MKQQQIIPCDTVIAGGGIAGLTTALELLQNGQHVYLIDRDTQERLGGLARWAFGGMALSGTKQQKFMGIPDDPQLLLKDWLSFADFAETDIWPKAWAEHYANYNLQKVYCWLLSLGLKFLPAVNWVERGLYTPGNSLPRYHVLWGTGWELIKVMLSHLEPFITSGQLKIFYQHKVIKPVIENDHFCFCEVENEQNHKTFAVYANNMVIACGGINGSSKNVIKNWYKPWGKPPKQFWNGANPISDGSLHERTGELGAKLTHLDKMWNYAAGVKHPQAEFAGHGLSLIPCKSALWLDHTGKRIGPQPLVTGFDTNYLCQQVVQQEKPWTWQILNWDIAAKELAVSGSLHNQSIRDKKWFSFAKEIIFGNHRLVKQLADQCDDFLCADNLEELTLKMNAITDKDYIDEAFLKLQVDEYDRKLSRSKQFQNDDQIRRIDHARQWRPDRLRTCKPKPLLAKGRGKLIAIKLQLISRKSLGGIQTNLDSQVLNNQGQSIDGLYCVGEAAGFGGGGANGLRSLEGTFLSACILTARNAVAAITQNQNTKHKTQNK
jgi:predicted oxidoreductase